MKAILQRLTNTPVWGSLIIDGELCCHTLEHPELKIAPGRYKCRRVSNRRTSGGMFIETTFEVIAPPRSGLLFHIGNYIKDTEGCPLLGAGFYVNIREPMLWQSAEAFKRFLKFTEDVDAFDIDILPAP